MANPLTSLTFLLLTLLALAAWGAALHRLRRPTDAGVAGALQQWLVGIVCLGSAAVVMVRWIVLEHEWQPVAAHVDGLALIAALFAGATLYVQSRPRLFGLSAFALPVLALILAWAICAAAWTFRPFETLDPLWMGLHLMGVYLGTASAAVAAIAGSMFLYIQSRLKHKHGLQSFGHLASLEALETLIVRTATLGFVLLTLGLVAGLIVLSVSDAGLIPTWWYIPKLTLAFTTWLVYAVVMNIRYATRFRGARAAWLAIVGLVLLLATYGLVTALPHEPRAEETAAAMVVDGQLPIANSRLTEDVTATPQSAIGNRQSAMPSREVV
ncbi:MAG: cytochrome c biogenesis protein CcsA [Phycisphaeraceae bacterium]